MRYVYEINDSTGRRRDVTTNVQEVLKEVLNLTEPWIVYVTDNMSRKVVQVIRSIDALEEWADTAARNTTWSDKSVKDRVKANLVEAGFPEHLAKTECVTCGRPWDPFDPMETEIRMVERPQESTMQKLVDSNLKTAASIGKAPFQAVPPIAYVALGKAMQNGEDKYERFNWREAGATSSVFFNAMMRHLLDWYSGEDHASDSKVHHLAHLMAGCAIVLDAKLHDKLNDDRAKVNVKLVEDMVKLLVAK